MKRIIGVILVLTLLLSFFGCREETVPKAGYATAVQLLDAYVGMRFGGDSVSKDTYKQITVDKWWDYLAEKSDLSGYDALYDEIKKSIDTETEMWRGQFGSEYVVSYGILDMEENSLSSLEEMLDYEWDDEAGQAIADTFGEDVIVCMCHYSLL